MATIQRTYNVPLRKGYINHPRWKKSQKAVTVLKVFLKKHTKREDVKMGMHLNEFIWKHGIKNPPHHVKIDVWIEDDYAKAELSGHEYKEAVRPEKKQDEGSLKDKLAKKIGIDTKDEKPPKTDEKAAEEPEKKQDKKVVKETPAKKQAKKDSKK